MRLTQQQNHKLSKLPPISIIMWLSPLIRNIVGNYPQLQVLLMWWSPTIPNIVGKWLVNVIPKFLCRWLQGQGHCAWTHLLLHRKRVAGGWVCHLSRTKNRVSSSWFFRAFNRFLPWNMAWNIACNMGIHLKSNVCVWFCFFSGFIPPECMRIYWALS